MYLDKFKWSKTTDLILKYKKKKERNYDKIKFQTSFTEVGYLQN